VQAVLLATVLSVYTASLLVPCLVSSLLCSCAVGLDHHLFTCGPLCVLYMIIICLHVVLCVLYMIIICLHVVLCVLYRSTVKASGMFKIHSLSLLRKSSRSLNRCASDCSCMALARTLFFRVHLIVSLKLHSLIPSPI
jgi:hypothetical protein